jgi:hypothetical protein
MLVRVNEWGLGDAFEDNFPRIARTLERAGSKGPVSGRPFGNGEAFVGVANGGSENFLEVLVPEALQKL